MSLGAGKKRNFVVQSGILGAVCPLSNTHRTASPEEKVLPQRALIMIMGEPVHRHGSWLEFAHKAFIARVNWACVSFHDASRRGMSTKHGLRYSDLAKIIQLVHLNSK